MKYYIVQYVLYIRIHQTTLDTNCIQMFSVPTICSLSPTPFLPVWPAVVLLAQPRAASLAAKSLAVQVVLVPTLFCIICEISKKKSCCILKRVRVVLLGFQTQGLCIPAFHERCEAASGPNDFDSFSFDNSMTVRYMRTFEAIYKHMQAFRIALETRNFIKSSHCLHSEEMLFNN